MGWRPILLLKMDEADVPVFPDVFHGASGSSPRAALALIIAMFSDKKIAASP
jgi:hypothetical protein